MEKKNGAQIFLTGIIRENPVLVLLLGTCPALAVTSQAIGGLSMGIAATIVLVCSNVVISLLKFIIPDKVRIPCYIVVIAGFVSIVQMVVKAKFELIDELLGVYLPLIVVNCIILGRAEMFASKNSVIHSALDGLGMGLGFTAALVFMGCLREFIGNGSLFGFALTSRFIEPVGILGMAPGGFFVFGITIALVNRLTKNRAIKRTEMGCAGCPSAGACAAAEEAGEEAPQ